MRQKAILVEATVFNLNDLLEDGWRVKSVTGNQKNFLVILEMEEED